MLAGLRGVAGVALVGLLVSAGCSSTTVDASGGTTAGDGNSTASSSSGATSSGGTGSSSSGATSSGGTGSSSSGATSSGGSSSSSSSSTGGSGGQAASPNAYFRAIASTAQEAATTVQVEVDLTAPATQAVTVPYLVSGAARSGRDFAALSGSLTLAAGDSNATIAVQLLPNGLITGDLDLVLTLRQPCHANLDANTTYTLTIQDADTVAVAQDGHLTAYPDATVSGALTSNVLDPNVAVQYALVNDGQLGTVTITDPNTGAYTYAGGSARGADSFTFTVTALNATSAPATVSVDVVTAPVPKIGQPANAIYQSPRGPLQQGTQGVFTATADANATGPIECAVVTPFLDGADPSNIASPISCDQLPSLVTDGNGVSHLGTATFAAGVLTWTPPRTVRGTYAFELSVPGNGDPGENFFFVTVTDAVPGAAPTHVLDAAISQAPIQGLDLLIAPGIANNTPWAGWPDLVGKAAGTSAGFSANATPWTGAGLGADPYALLLNPASTGAGDSVQWPVAPAASYRVSAWLAPAAGNLPGAVLLSNVDLATGHGLTLRQSPFTADTLELWAGVPSTSPLQAVNAVDGDQPLGHWPLHETAGALGADSSPLNNPAQFHQVVLNAEQHDGAPAVGFGDGYGLLLLPNAAYETDDATFEVWLRPDWAAAVNNGDEGVFGMYHAQPNGDAKRIQMLLSPNDTTPGFDSVTVTGGTNGAIFAAPMGDGNWHHLVYTESSGTATVYVDGVQTDSHPSPKDTTVTDFYVTVGDQPDGQRPFHGSMQDLALYDYALSAADVARHYQAHAAVACQSHTRFAAGQFHQVAMDYDSVANTSTLWVDGHAECVLPTTQGAGGDLTVGADPNQENFWSGAVARLETFAGVAGAVESFADFAAVANRFRGQPEADIVTPYTTAAQAGPVYSFDAANGDGLRPYLDGAGNCVGDFTVWKNQGSAGGVGTMLDFLATGMDKCGASSPEHNMWQGTGTPNDPYAVRYAIQYGYVTLPTDTTDWTEGVSFEVWANTTAGQGLPRFMEMASQPNYGDNINFWRTGDGFSGKGPNSLILSVYDAQTVEHRAFSEDAVIDGEWHQYAAVAQQDSAGVVSYHFYRDGKELQVIDADPTLVLPHNVPRPRVFIAHSNFQADDVFVGGLGVVRVYNRPLSGAEIQQNCAMTAANFGVTCQP